MNALSDGLQEHSVKKRQMLNGRDMLNRHLNHRKFKTRQQPGGDQKLQFREVTKTKYIKRLCENNKPSIKNENEISNNLKNGHHSGRISAKDRLGKYVPGEPPKYIEEEYEEEEEGDIDQDPAPKITTELGTLHNIKKEEIQLEDEEEKKTKIERRLEEEALKEKEFLVLRKRELFMQRKQKQKDIKNNEIKMELERNFEIFERQTNSAMNFIKTEFDPSLFYLPKMHNEKTEKKLQKTRTYLSNILRKKRYLVESEIEKLLQPSDKQMEYDRVEDDEVRVVEEEVDADVDVYERISAKDRLKKYVPDEPQKHIKEEYEEEEERDIDQDPAPKITTELGTLHKIKKEEIQLEDEEEKKPKIEKRLEEEALKEKEFLVLRKRELFMQRKQKQKDIKNNEIKMELERNFEIFERQTNSIMNFIKTEFDPSLFYLPKMHNEKTEKKLQKTRTYLSNILRKKRFIVESEIEKLLQPSDEKMEYDRVEDDEVRVVEDEVDADVDVYERHQDNETFI